MRRWPKGCGRWQSLDDPIGEELERKTLDGRSRPAQAAGPAWRRRRRLRGAPQRDDRLRGADDQERQRDRPARIQLCRTLERRAGRGRPRGAGRGRPPGGRGALLAGGGREDLAELATQEGNVDLLIPRGGEGLKKALKDVATVPVIYAAAGNCHVYVHATPTWRWRGGSPSTPRCSGPASATPPRRCWSMPPWPRPSCPARSAISARRASSWSATSARARWPAGSRSARPARRTGRPSTST